MCPGVDGTKWGKLSPRSIPLLKETVDCSLERTVQLPAKMVKGDVFMVDAGKLVQAYSVLEFECRQQAVR